MNKMIILAITVLMLTGCSSGIKIVKPIGTQATIGIVPFADCNTGQYSDCEGSGLKVATVYAKTLNGVITTKEEATKFDVLITGNIYEYNIARPFMFRPNMINVGLRIVTKTGDLVGTQASVAAENNIFGSIDSCNKTIAEALKTELGR